MSLSNAAALKVKKDESGTYSYKFTVALSGSGFRTAKSARKAAIEKIRKVKVGKESVAPPSIWERMSRMDKHMDRLAEEMRGVFDEH